MSRLRTFVAVPLADDLRDQLETLQDRMRRHLPQLKWVEVANLHVTLVFLGEVEDRELSRVCTLTQTAAAELAPFTLSLAGAGAFPTARRPRVIWAGIDAGAAELTQLHDRLATAFGELGYRREDRPFSPHITLARTKTDDGNGQVAAVLGKFTDWHGGAMTVAELHVMSSELTRDGPHYTVLGRIPLGGVAG
jgi:2'-5' RNA ligase